MGAAPTLVEIFCSYAHEDEVWLRKLEIHLSLLKRQGLISLWYDRLIAPGTDWTHAIDRHLETASVILLLVSADFFASDYCYGIEMQQALKRHEAGEARVIPLLVRPVDWKNAPFAHLQALPTDARPLSTWQNEDTALTDVVTGIRRVLEDLPLLAASAPRAALPGIWNIPYPRNPFFLGRDEVLEDLHTRLQAGHATALSQPQAISGLAGIGKTQLALEYAYRYHQDYTAVLWARAESTEALISSYVALTALLRLPEREVKEQEVIVQAVKAWLQTHHGWLLIMDNADDLSLLPDMLPPGQLRGHLLLTTRRQALGGLANRIEIRTLDQPSGTLLLLRRAGLLPLEVFLALAKEADLLDAQQLWQELDGLPLALDQAGAYIEETHCSLSDYLYLFRTQRGALLKQRGGVLHDHPESVYTTFTLAINAISQLHPAAVDLLQVCALLYPDAIPEELFLQGAGHLGIMLETVCTDLLAWNKLLAAICAYSLLQRQSNEQTLTMHRLVQAVIQESMPKSTSIQWTYRVIGALEAVFPHSEYATRSACERLVLHALSCAVGARFLTHEPPELASLLCKIAAFLVDRGQWKEAELLYQWALRIWEQALGPDHPNVADPLNGLANLYHKQGKLEDAEPLYQRAWHIWEQTSGPFGLGHPNMAYSLNGLATLYHEQGRYQEAESLYRRVLHIWGWRPDEFSWIENQFIENQISLLRMEAKFYEMEGKHKRAKSLHQRASRIHKQPLKPDNLGMAYPLNGLANLYREQGKYEQAKSLYQRALRIREQMLGSQHPETAETMHDFARFWEAQDNGEEASVWYARALAVREQALGAQHPKTRETRRRFVTLLRVLGQHEQAVQLERDQAES